MSRPTPTPRRPTDPRLLAFLTLALPFVLLGAVELGLRLWWDGGREPLFVAAPQDSGRYLVANHAVATRYFPTESLPPAPPRDYFATERPARSFRVFVMGESSTAGFPYPHNGPFSRVLADALRDVRPADSVEVINLGIAATNSYQILDLVGEVIAQRPDAVLIYAGHNEYYGALGVGSTVRLGASPTLVRLYLAAMRWRTIALADRGLRALRRKAQRPPSRSALEEASFMETVARDQDLQLGSPRYVAGERQFDGNLRRVLHRLRKAGIPTLVGSVASNVRDQAPFAAPGNLRPDGARAAWERGQRALEAGDTATARTELRRAHDLDVVRFRAPLGFTELIREAAADEGATYVPAAEAFERASPGGLPGHELLLEHVHPTQDGAVLLAQVFFDAMREHGLLGPAPRLDALRPWDEYRERMALSPLDVRIAEHSVASITARWPFVPVDSQRDYRGTYRPVSALDSVALLVSRGGLGWEAAKLARTDGFLEAKDYPDAIAEIRGLVRDAPWHPIPLLKLANAQYHLGLVEAADSSLRRAWAHGPSAGAAFLIGQIAVQRKDAAEGVRWLRTAVQLDPRNEAAQYQLSLAYALAGDVERARQVAVALYRRSPGYPGLAQWLRLLGSR